jgi:hypothetical protein
MKAGVDLLAELEETNDEIMESPGMISDKERDHYPVYVIYSSYPLSEIKRRLSTYAKRVEKRLIDGGMSKNEVHKRTKVGPLRIVRSRGEQTDRTISVMGDEVYQELVKDGKKKNGRQRRFNLDDFQIRPYHLAESQRPKKRDMRHLMVCLPKVLSRIECDKQLRHHMTDLVNFGVVSADAYQIAIPFESRENDNHVGRAFLVFADHVNIWDIVITHATLRETIWTTKKNNPLSGDSRWRHCFWAKITDPGSIRMSPADRLQDKSKHQNVATGKPQPQRRRAYNRSRRSRESTPIISPPTTTHKTAEYAPLHMVQPVPLRQAPPQNGVSPSYAYLNPTYRSSPMLPPAAAAQYIGSKVPTATVPAVPTHVPAVSTHVPSFPIVQPTAPASHTLTFSSGLLPTAQ